MRTLVTVPQAQRRFAMIIIEVFTLVGPAPRCHGRVRRPCRPRDRAHAEIGVRVARGATPTLILRLLVREDLRLTLVNSKCAHCVRPRLGWRHGNAVDGVL